MKYALGLGILLSFTITQISLAAPRTDGQVILQYIHEDNRDLGQNDADPSRSFSEQVYLGLRNNIDRYRSWRVSGRVFNINSHNVVNNDDGEPSNPIVNANGAFFELREAYYRDKAVLPGIDLQIGRQFLREPRGLWWGSNADLVRISRKWGEDTGFVAAGEDLGSYRTGEEELARDEKRFRILGEYRHAYKKGHWIEPRFVFEHDRSEKHGAGEAIQYEDIDNDDLTGIYAGVRSTGVFEDRYGLHKIFYRGDIIGLGGEQRREAVRGVNGIYSVNAVETGAIREWAFDGGVSVQPWQDGAVFKAGYAIGSEDFRQTGLEGGSGRNDLERYAQRNYGEVFRPELSNIQIATFGMSYPLSPVWTMGADYYRYHQTETAGDIRRSGLRADPDGRDGYLGQEIDLRLSADLDDVVPLKGLHGVQWQTVGGMFDPGDAFETGSDDAAFRVFSEFRIRF